MPLDTVGLKNGIKALNDELYANAAGLTPAQASERHAAGLAALMEAFVKSGDGYYVTGKLTAGAVPVTPVGLPPIVKIN